MYTGQMSEMTYLKKISDRHGTDIPFVLFLHPIQTDILASTEIQKTKRFFPGYLTGHLTILFQPLLYTHQRPSPPKLIELIQPRICISMGEKLVIHNDFPRILIGPNAEDRQISVADRRNSRWKFSIYTISRPYMVMIG